MANLRSPREIAAKSPLRETMSSPSVTPTEQSDYDRLQHPRITDLWSGLLDTGLSETRGNSALLAFNLAGKAARVTTRNKISLYSNIIYANR